MTEILDETLSEHTQPALGNLAVDAAEKKLFTTTDKEVSALVPSLEHGTEALRSMLVAYNPQIEASRQNNQSATNAKAQAPSRERTRQAKSAYGPQIARVITTGAGFLASFDDIEEGVKEGRKIFVVELDQTLGDLYYSRIVPAAEPLRRLRKASANVAAEVDTALGSDPDSVTKRYTFLKALTPTPKALKGDLDAKEIQESLDECTPKKALGALVIMNNSGDKLQRQLTQDLLLGTFDSHIALDVLSFADSTQTPVGDLARVKQLTTFLAAFLGESQGDRSEVHLRMAAVIDAWPAGHRAIVRDAARSLLQRLESNFSALTVALKQDGLIAPAEPKKAFEASFDKLADEIFRRAVVTPENKGDIMRLRAAKRGRLPKQKSKKSDDALPEIVASAEAPREPFNIITCNLNDYSVAEGVQGQIDDFIVSVGQGSNANLRTDLERIVSYMARRDLPFDLRRGIKAIGGTLW